MIKEGNNKIVEVLIVDRIKWEGVYYPRTGRWKKLLLFFVIRICFGDKCMEETSYYIGFNIEDVDYNTQYVCLLKIERTARRTY